MYIGYRYGLFQTLHWSRRNVIGPFVYASAATAAYSLLDLKWLAIPTFPLTSIGVAVAFYLGFKNNASYDRLWEARKIWGAIVNASRSFAMTVRDLVVAPEGADVRGDAVGEARSELVRRHVAWMDALRHQLRKAQPWEHRDKEAGRWRELLRAEELNESLEDVLSANVSSEEARDCLAKINPAAHLLSGQSRRLAALRRDGLVDGFAHFQLQELVRELMAQQGKAERIKNFPFPRQYATVNSLFAGLFALMVPFGMITAFESAGPGRIWLVVPFSTVVSWVFLTTDQIGGWSENPFEGLSNDVPITTLARGIERDILELVGESELPPAREARAEVLL